MKMNKKIMIGLAMLATAMMIVVPFAVMQDGVDADYEYKVITDNGLYIAPAILNDTSDTPIEISDYGTISLSGNVITLTLSEAYYHKNGEGNYGFWMGVAFASVNKEKTLYYAWDKTTAPTSATTEANEGNVLVYDQTQYNGVAFYVAPGNGTSLNANSEYYVALKVAGGNVVNYTVKVVVEKYSVSTAVALQTALKAKGTINIDITGDITATIGTDINLENPGDINCRFFGATNYVSDITVNGNEHKVSISGTVGDGYSSVSVFYFINGENPEPNVPVSNLVKPKVSINKLTVDSNITVGTFTHPQLVTWPTSQHGFNAYGDKASVTYTEVTSKNNKSAGFSVSGGAEVTLKACGTEGNSAATVGTPWAAVRVGSDDEIATANIGTGCVFKEQLPLWAESENAKVKFSDTETWLESEFAISAPSISKTLYYKNGSIPEGTFPTVTIGTSVAYTFTLGKGTWTSPGVITVPDSCTMVIGDDGSFAFGSSSSIVSENKVTGKILCSEKEIKVEDFKGTLTYDAAGPKLTNYTSGTITQSTSAIKANVADYGSSIPVYTDYKVTQTGNNATATISGLVAHRNAHTVYSYWSGVGFEPALAGATGFQYYWADEAGGTISWSDTQDLGTDTSVMFYVPGGTIQKFIAIKWIYGTTGFIIENSFTVSFNTAIKSGAFAAPTGNIIVRGTFANGISLTSGSITTDGDTAGPITGNVTCGTDTLSLEAFDGAISASNGKMEVTSWTAGTLGITKGTVNMATTIGAEQTLDLAKGVTLGVLAGKILTLEGKIINNGTIDVYGTLDSSACGGEIGTTGVSGSGVLNVYNLGEFKMGAATPIAEIPTGQFLGTMKIFTGGELAGITSGDNKLVTLSGEASYLQVVSKSTKTVRNVEYSLFGTGTINDATAYAGAFFAAGDKLVVAKGATLTVEAMTINSAVNLTVEGTLYSETGTIYVKGAGAIVIDPTGVVNVNKIDFQTATANTKVVTIKQGGKLTAVLDGSEENKVSVLEVENIVAGVGGITVTKGSVYINGVMATADATGTITIPATAPGSVVYVSGTVEEGVKVVVPAGTSVIVPKETTLTFETDSELSYDAGATIGFEDATSAIIYEKGSVVNDVVIEVETKEDTNGTVTAVHIYLVSENEKKLIISVDYVEVLPGKTYGDALNGVIVMPTKKSVTFDGWYNLAFNEKIRSTDIVGNNDVTLTACFSDEGRVPVQKEDTPSETIIIDGTTDSQSFAGSDFALPVAIICLIVAILALGFVVLKKR